MKFPEEHAPEAFSRFENGETKAIVLSKGAASIADALLRGKNCVSLDIIGRGTVASFPWLGDRQGILRKYRRGGLARFLVHDRFILANRPLHEFRVHNAVQQMGIPVPRLLGVCWRRNGIFYSGALATEKADGPDLHDWLLSVSDETEERFRVLGKCGVLIRQMHDAGVTHGDLQVKNILITSKGPLLIDFDAAKIDPWLKQWRRECNLLRLRRSFLKRGHENDCFEALLAGYGQVKFHRVLNIFYSVRGYVSDRISSWSKP